jgi:hypothetical protein
VKLESVKLPEMEVMVIPKSVLLMFLPRVKERVEAARRRRSGSGHGGGP